MPSKHCPKGIRLGVGEPIVGGRSFDDVRVTCLLYRDEMNTLAVCLTVLIAVTAASRDGRIGFCVPGMRCSTDPVAVCKCWGRLEACCSGRAMSAKEQPVTEQQSIVRLQRVYPTKVCNGWGDFCGVEDQTCVCARIPPCTCWMSSA